MNEVNQYISRKTGIDYDILMQLFIESVKEMKIDHKLINVAQQLKKQGKIIALVTNNMDVFDEVTVPHHRLDEIFSTIVSSCNYGILKHENEGKLFDRVLEKLGLTNYNEVLLIDDSQKACAAFEKKGGDIFHYTDFETFYERGKQHLHLLG